MYGVYNSVVNQMPSQCMYVLEFIVSLVITVLGEILSVYVHHPLSDWSLWTTMYMCVPVL